MKVPCGENSSHGAAGDLTLQLKPGVVMSTSLRQFIHAWLIVNGGHTCGWFMNGRLIRETVRAQQSIDLFKGQSSFLQHLLGACRR